MAVDSTKRLGYGGSAEIDGTQVLMTSGGFDTATAISYLEPLSIPPPGAGSGGSAVTRSRVEHADGTSGYTGNVSFDVTATALSSFLTTTKLLARGYRFTVGINDGESAEEMTDVHLTSLSLSGAPQGLITCSISFTGATAPASSVGVANAFIGTQEPLGYWVSGNTDVRDWTFTMNQAVTPMYINQAGTDARYLKVGLFDFILEVTTYEAVVSTSVINISTSSFTLTGNQAGESFNFQGITELGGYRSTFETSADIGVGSGGTIIT